MRVLAVSGSLRAGSYNTLLLEEAAAAAPAGVELELFDSSLLGELPAYDQPFDPANRFLFRDAGIGHPIEMAF